MDPLRIGDVEALESERIAAMFIRCFLRRKLACVKPLCGSPQARRVSPGLTLKDISGPG